MYAEFVEWVEKRRNTWKLERGQSHKPVLEGKPDIQLEALIFFERKQAFDALGVERSNRTWIKEHFSGSIVREYADLGGYWKGVKLIMDEVRVRLGGDEGILIFLDKNGEQNLKDVVLQVKDELGIVSSMTQDSNGR
jgi:hypothetical protein